MRHVPLLSKTSRTRGLDSSPHRIDRDRIPARELDATPQIAGQERRSRIWVVIGMVLVALAVLFSVLVWLGAP